MSEEEWVVELRSCLTSVKNGIPLDQIESDLFNMTGTKIPYKNLGYLSLEACLSSSGQFTISNHGGVSIVHAVASKKTQHLTELIKKQKSKLPKKKFNKRKVIYNYTAPNALVDNSESKNLKKQNLKEIKISESKKRSFSQCECSFLLDEISKYHDCNNFNELLFDVEKWDIKNPNQYKHINKFECLVCYFKTNTFNDWKLHIISILHLLNCQEVQDLYSFVCSTKGCKVLLYGPHKLLNEHKAKHSEFGISFNSISLLMVEVMNRYINKQNNILFFCTHCKKFNEDSIHCTTKKMKISFPIRFFCVYCKVDFYSSPEMIDYHSLTVEHLTLKCFDKLLLKGKTNFKKMKFPEQSNENGIINNSVPLSNLVENTSLFENSDSVGNDNKHVPIVQVKKSLANEVIVSTPTVIFNQKSQELNPVDSQTTTPNKIIDQKLLFDVASTCDETVSDDATNFENENKLDEDEAYGNYVTQRLKNISNSTIKQNIKLEIDYLFYIKQKTLSIKSE